MSEAVPVIDIVRELGYAATLVLGYYLREIKSDTEKIIARLTAAKVKSN